MAIQAVPQGVLNRLLASFVCPLYPGLNVSTPYLGRDAMRLNLSGNATTQIDTMTGVVQSPEPYMKAELTMNLLRTQALAAAWRAQMERSTVLGDCTAYGDAITSTQPVYALKNMAIMTLREMTWNGEDPGYVLTLAGIYYINSSLFQ